jgi:broad specificity phosphatase PhoE
MTPRTHQTGPVPTRILLVRHAESTWNASGRWQGWADPPLTEDGEATARRVTPPAVAAVVSSDLTTGGPVRTFRGLRERGAGEWTGLTKAEIQQRWGDRPLHDIPGGEAPDAVAARAVATLHRIAAAWPDQDVLAVGHGALIRQVERHAGCEPGPVHHLAGRWIEVDARGLRAGDLFSLL